MGTKSTRILPHPLLQAFAAVQMDTTAIMKDGKRIGTATVARFDFDTEDGEQILVNTALSGVSMEGAAKNLTAEVPENDFENTVRLPVTTGTGSSLK